MVSINFTVKKISKTSEEAQKDSQKIVKNALKVLDKNGIDKVDIKTLDYTTRPEYERESPPCQVAPCPPSKQVLKGFVASQSFSVAEL